MKALWRLYISGRRGFERELGYVIAKWDNFDWLTERMILKQPHLCCDIFTMEDSLEELLQNR